MESVDLIAACLDSIRQVGSLRHFVLIPGTCLPFPISFRRYNTRLKLLSLLHLGMRICLCR